MQFTNTLVGLEFWIPQFRDYRNRIEPGDSIGSAKPSKPILKLRKIFFNIYVGKSIFIASRLIFMMRIICYKDAST